MPLPSSALKQPTFSASWDDFRALVESAVEEAAFMLDGEGHVLSWGPRAEKMVGHPAAEIIGEHLSKFAPPEDVHSNKPAQQLAIAADLGRFEQEGWRVRKDGSRFWANLALAALHDNQGKLAGFAAVMRDLSAKNTTATQLRGTQQDFHHLVDAITDYAVYMLDPSGNVATWNPGAEKAKGYRAEEILGKSFSVFYTAEDREAGKPERVLQTVRQEGRFAEEAWRVRKDGTRFWASVVLTALRDDQGKLIGFAKVTRDLSERRTAEEELRRSEERFRLLVENVVDYAIYMLDVTGRVVTWNLGAERMKGYTAREIIGRSFECFFPESDVAAGKPARELAEAKLDGRFEDEGWRVRKDGTRFWANALLTALHDASGELVGFAKITRDLSARRESEEKDRQLLHEQIAREMAEKNQAELRASEERYRALGKRLEIVLEGVADGITVQDASGRLVFANTAAARICGFVSGAELVGAPPEEIIAHFEILDTERRPFKVENLPARRVLAGEEPNSAVLYVRERATRRDSWVQLRANAVLGSDGKPELAINIWHDVTAEHRQEVHTRFLAEASAALASSLNREEMLTALARVLVPKMADWCSVDLLDGERLRDVAVVYASDDASASQTHLHDYPPAVARSGAVSSVIRTGTAEVFNELSEGTLAQSTTEPETVGLLAAVGVKAALIVPIRTRDRVFGAIGLYFAEPGRRYDASDIVLADELGRRAGGTVENAELYKAAQDAARAAEVAAKNAEAAARLAEEASRAKDEFLATVSHELRTPLNAILGWSTLLKDRLSETSAAKPIEVIHRNAHAQARIIDDILDVSRVVTGKFNLDLKPADLAVVVRHAIDVVRPSAEAKRIAIEFVPEAEFPLVVVDAERLQQVVWNLLSNAVKFTPRDGRIQIELRQERSQLVLIVKDTGEGIDPAFLPFVFDRFKQADSSTTRRVGGLGLGLALVRHIIELHGGRVEAASAGQGQGSTFTITLPVRAVMPQTVTPSPALQPSAEPSIQSRIALDGVRVLVVDDEPDARHLVAAVLSEAGADVKAVPSALDAFAMFKEFRPNVIVSDIGMPDEDGFSFIQRIRALPAGEGGQVPSLALTAFAHERDRERALGVGYTAHLGKPVEPHVLATAVASLLGLPLLH